MIRETYVILSEIVDNMLSEMLPDTTILLFNDLDSLLDYTENTAIRATRMYITKEILQSNTRDMLQTLLFLLDSSMLKVDSMTYITEKGSKELGTIEYILNDKGKNTWNYEYGTLSRDFVYNLICGNIEDTSERGLQKKSVYRIRKSEFIDNKLKNKETLESHYESEEEKLSKLPDESEIEMPDFNYKEDCKIIYNTGIESKERTLFSFLLAQYCSFEGKTIIIERDYEYLTLSDIVERAENCKLFKIDIQDFYSDFSGILREIKICPENLIVLKCSKRGLRSYNFIFNILYANLKNDIQYILREDPLSDVIPNIDYNIVFPSEITSLLKTVDMLPSVFNATSRYVGIVTTAIKELAILDTRALRSTVAKALNYQDDPIVSIVSITSLILGGEAHDLRMYL